MEHIERLGEYSPDIAIEITGWLGRLHLVQPYNWRAWTVEPPAVADIASLPLADCVLQITRIARADRVEGGLLMSCARTGYLRALCERVAELVARDRVPVVPKPPVAI